MCYLKENDYAINNKNVVWHRKQLVISEGTDNQHKNILEMVRKYQSDLEEFGNVDFKSTLEHGQKRATEYALLNEQQATLILTYMRNSNIVRAFKIGLVNEFCAMAGVAITEATKSLPTEYHTTLRVLVFRFGFSGQTR